MFPYNFIGFILLFSNVYSRSILDSYVVPAIDNQKAPLMAIFDTRSMSLQIAKSLEDPLSKYINDSFDKQVEELVKLKMKEYSMRMTDHVDKLVESRKNALTLKIEEQMKEYTHNGYIGCYKDDADRHLKKRGIDTSKSMTLAKCKELCKGYTYAGLQNPQCFCGNILAKKAYHRVPDMECNQACTGDRSKMCGGIWRNSIYTV